MQKEVKKSLSMKVVVRISSLFLLGTMFSCQNQNKLSSKIEWTKFYSADSLYSVELPKKYDNQYLECKDMSFNYEISAVDANHHDNVIVISINSGKDCNFAGDSLKKSFRYAGHDRKGTIKYKLWCQEDSLIVYRSLNRKHYIYHLLCKTKNNEEHIYDIVIENHSAGPVNLSAAKHIAKSIEDNTIIIIEKFLSPVTRGDRYIYEKSHFSIDTNYLVKPDFEDLRDNIDEYRKLNQDQRSEYPMLRGTYLVRGKELPVLFSVVSFEFPLCQKDYHEVLDRVKQNLYNNHVNFIERDEENYHILQFRNLGAFSAHIYKENRVLSVIVLDGQQKDLDKFIKAIDFF